MHHIFYTNIIIIMERMSSHPTRKNEKKNIVRVKKKVLRLISHLHYLKTLLLLLLLFALLIYPLTFSNLSFRLELFDPITLSLTLFHSIGLNCTHFVSGIWSNDCQSIHPPSHTTTYSVSIYFLSVDNARAEIHKKMFTKI